MTGWTFTIALGLAVASGAACSSKHDGSTGEAAAAAPEPAATGERVVARVGGGAISADRYARRLVSARATARGQDPPDPRALLDDMIAEELLVQEALRDGVLDNDPELRKRLVDRLLAARGVATDLPEPTADQLRAFWNRNRATLPAEERVRFSHIAIAVAPDADAAVVARARRRAEQLRGQVLAAPDRFADLARKSSQDPTAERGGAVGPVPVSRLYLAYGDPLAEMLARLTPGGIGEVVRTRFGFHVVRLDERLARNADPAASNDPALRARWREQQLVARRQQLVDGLRARHPVTIDEAALTRAAGGP